jgi:transposase-like protein
MRKLVVLCWKLGLSYRGIAMVLSAFGVNLGRMSAWRDVQGEAHWQMKNRQWKKVRILGLDGAYVLGWGKKRSVLVAVDLGEGQPVTLGYIDEHDPWAVKRWLAPLVQRLGVSVIVTDDLWVYRQVADDLDLTHQVCQFHVRRWVGRELYRLKEEIPDQWLWVIEKVQDIIDDLPDNGAKQLFELWKQLPGRTTQPEEERTPLEQLRDMIIRLSERWERYIQFVHDPGIPWTNNGTEQVIGRMKMRARSVRGYKNWQGMQSGLMVSGGIIA